MVALINFAGQMEIDLGELQSEQRYKTWYRLQHSDHVKGKDKKLANMGHVMVT